MHSPHLKMFRLSTVGLTLVAALLLVTACAKKTEQDIALNAAVKRYERVRSGMTKQEVVALLGEPSVRQEGLYRWQTTGRAPNNAAIEVRFNSEDRITSVANTRARD